MKMLKLWPEGTPNDNGLKEQKENGPLYVAEPTLYVYPAKEPNGMAIIACPGGGYYGLATGHEGHDMAAWFNDLGITYSVLIYRMPNGNNEVPLSDAQQAIKIMREKAQEWKFSKLGIMGSSAGGHLASTAATHFDEKTRPDFQILFYPVITMTEEPYVHEGSRDNLLGTSPTPEMCRACSPELLITPQTPPALLFHAADDNGVKIQNAMRYVEGLQAQNIPAQLITLPSGGHGFGFYPDYECLPQVEEAILKWLYEVPLKNQ